MHLLSICSIASVLFLTSSRAQYILAKDFFAADFFDSFDFWNNDDPTHGFVRYEGRDDSLITSSTGNAQMRVSTESYTPLGRPSIRITSKQAYERGLVILDLEHMPGGICGTWPAFWMVGPDWPNGGEIGTCCLHNMFVFFAKRTQDIIEGTNDAQSNQMTLHTGSSCSISQTSMAGTISTHDCEVTADDNSGCGIITSNNATYGTTLNSIGGGVYATLLTGANVVIWFWPRDQVPDDVVHNSPNPDSWPVPLANFSGACDFDTSFAAQNLVFDTTFCGDWAGQQWSDTSCIAKAASCEDYVKNNGVDFADAYWSINGLKIYEKIEAPQTSITPFNSSQLSASAPSSRSITSTALSSHPTRPTASNDTFNTTANLLTTLSTAVQSSASGASISSTVYSAWLSPPSSSLLGERRFSLPCHSKTMLIREHIVGNLSPAYTRPAWQTPQHFGLPTKVEGIEAVRR